MRPLWQALYIISLVLAVWTDSAHAQAINTSCVFDQGEPIPGGAFDFGVWFQRGTCVHDIKDYVQCRSTLQDVLSSLDSLHSAEYSAAATVLALLPTIGAVLGSPSAEIWILLKILPFGGTLAMLLSFGSSMIPTALKDYYQDSSAVAHGGTMNSTGRKIDDDNLPDEVMDRISEKLRNGHALSPPRFALVSLLLALLLSGVLAGIAIIEYGAVYATWCTSTWWFHLWYITRMSTPSRLPQSTPTTQSEANIPLRPQ